MLVMEICPIYGWHRRSWIPGAKGGKILRRDVLKDPMELIAIRGTSLHLQTGHCIHG